MSEKRNPKRENPNIGENTRWDTPKVNPNAGSTTPKPPTFLNPNRNKKK